MLASITPLGQWGRGASWARMVAFYVVASAVGGAVTGAVLGGIGGLLPGVGSPGRLAVAAVASLCTVALDIRGRVPSVRRQVDETWLTRYRDWVCGVGFGFQLGAGAATIVTSASLYLTWLLEALAGSPVAGGLIGLVFGVMRAAPVLGNGNVVDAVSLRRSHLRWQHALRLVRPSVIATEAAVGVALLLAVTT